MKKVSNKEKLALKLARKYLQKEWDDEVLEELAVVWLSEEGNNWKCYVSHDELDRYGEHIQITYTSSTDEAYIQHFKSDDNMTIFVWNNMEVK